MFGISNFFNTTTLSRFRVPTTLLHGENARAHLEALLDRARPGAFVVDEAFLQDPFVSSLAAAGSAPMFVVKSEPDTELVDRCLATLQQKPAWIVALGGGSTIDTGKALLAHALFGEYRRVGYGDLRTVGDATLLPPRLIAVPTTAGTGSETSRYYLISDAKTREKLVARTWYACPEYAILDPWFLRGAPASVLVAGAFDTFVHHWETFVCRQERSPLTEMLALEGMSSVLLSLDAALDEHDAVALSRLQQASALGGMAISNVRTGFLHTAGEALAATVKLSHPLTLMVFFPGVLLSYEDAVAPRLQRLFSRLEGRISSVEEIIAFWIARFDAAGLLTQLRTVADPASASARLVIEKVSADRVLAEKEHPLPLDHAMIRSLVTDSLARAATFPGSRR